ncbi:sulfotransferase domain-containing protein [Methylovirgula sp. 4M-Z18]|uniref:sulfotransferase domain-containing protein n=1 Tax=Methylovirgula sp. 4M-Z18 TaxID=2293567 RepID=UPI00131401E0|nr:sulfotransferase domain-containing protein [Methylovirgula sp. 4M-Z18]
MGNNKLRIAIVSSPRCGNTWIRSTLSAAMNLVELSAHNYLDIAQPLPDRCILQVHWYREPNYQKWLHSHEFKVITLARHPLDILVSVTSFVRYEPMTERWLEGNAGLPGALRGKAPCSPDFLHYALSFEAENLLAVSYQWWHEPSALKLRYEDGVADIERTVLQVARYLGEDIGASRAWLDHASLPKMQALPNHHGWQGRPGLWRELILPQDALRIYLHHRNVFRRLGYSIEPYFYFLSRKTAEKNWIALSPC